jgi:hypothetical protein
MKKTYISPIVLVVKVATHVLLVESLQRGENISSGEGDARELDFDDEY